MKKLLMIVTAISVLVMSSVGAYAVGGDKEGHRGHNPAKMLKKMSRQLDLDENQRQQLKVIMEKQGADSKDSRQRLKELRTEAHEISSSSDPSGSQARRIANEIGEITADMAFRRMGLMNEFNGILTPEQKQKLEDITAKRMKRLQERKESHEKKRSEKAD